MECENIRAQFADYLAGALTDRARDELKEHLLQCAACRVELEAFSEMWTKLDEIPGERADSTAMRARFDAMVEGYEHGRARALDTKLGERLAAWFFQPRQIRPLVQAFAALVLLLAGAALGRQTISQPTPARDEQINTLRDELHEMRQMVTLSLLQQQSASERLRGVSWSNQLDMPGAEVVSALLDALKHDQNVNVRLASIDALKRFADDDGVRRACIDALNTQPSPLVQIALIDFMVETQARDSVTVLRRLSQDSEINGSVRARATLGLQKLGAV